MKDRKVSAVKIEKDLKIGSKNGTFSVNKDKIMYFSPLDY